MRFVPHDTPLTSASFLGIDFVGGTALRCLGCGLTLSCLFGLFRGRARIRAAACSSRWLSLRTTRARLLNYDVVLNVELVVHIYDVNLNSLARGSSLGLVLRLRWASSCATRIQIRGDNSLHMEELLVVRTAFLILHSRATISLLLDILGRVRASHVATGATAAARWL